MNNLTRDIYPLIKRESDRNIKTDEKQSRNNSPLLTIPAMPDNNNRIESEDPDDEFLRLTAMVREVYFSHLYKSLISNYLVCCKTSDKLLLEEDLKRFAGSLELDAVRASLEASLYRQAMLKMISDIKDHTSLKRVHKKLISFLNAAPNKIDVGVQTEELSDKTDKNLIPDTTTIFVKGKYSKVQSSSVTSNYDHSTASPGVIPERESVKSSLDERVSLILKKEENDEESCLVKSEKNGESEFEKVDNLEVENKDEDDEDEEDEDDDPFKSIEDFACLQTKNSNPIDGEDVEKILFKEDLKSVDLNLKFQENDNNESQDSILQNLEDMFCESNDSSDLTALIEKHSGVSKANVDIEIGKMCPKSCEPKSAVKFSTRKMDKGFDPLELNGKKRKLSFSNYKKLKRHANGGGGEDNRSPAKVDDEKKNKRESVWLVERIHQMSKLRAKMSEISSTNYRKYGRIKTKFIQLFGDNDEGEDDEEMMPDSPVCIEEHLSACKERIAPWVVKYLMPFYKKKIIIDRKLFKSVAKHVADMLIIENTFPEETDVNKYIQKYFKNKKAIKTKPDIFM